jgi:hypothetical protein
VGPTRATSALGSGARGPGNRPYPSARTIGSEVVGFPQRTKTPRYGETAAATTDGPWWVRFQILDGFKRHQLSVSSVGAAVLFVILGADSVFGQ